MNKTLALIIGAYIAGVLSSTAVLRAIGVHIHWFAPWLRPEGYTVLKSEYMELLRKYRDAIEYREEVD